MTLQNCPNLRFGFVWLAAFVAMLAGCQSMTRQQQAMNLPEKPDLFEKASLQVASQSLPALPPTFTQPTPAPVPKLFSVDPAKVVTPKIDTTLVQTAAHVGTAPPVFTPNPKLTAPLKPILADSDTTRKLVSNLVNASDSIAPLDSESEKPISTIPAALIVDKMVQKTAADRGPNGLPGATNPAAVPIQKSAVNAPLPALETLPQLKYQKDLPRNTVELKIPKAAICRSIQGRGNFVAMPAGKLNPGSTILVYWELDGLSRKGSDQMASIAATIELVRSDRELIMASVRENLDKTGKSPAEGDFAALRWAIPADLQPGEYRLRITSTDQNQKTTGQTDLELTVVSKSNSIITQ